ncbi:MAG: hypothetical protein R6X35_01475 [Candidatus Krumholzibacteriia bacterium]
MTRKRVSAPGLVLGLRIWLIGVMASLWLVAPLAAFGQQDLVGIYFDESGTINRWETTASPEYVRFWVVLKNISDLNGIGAIAIMGLASEGMITGTSLIGPMYFGGDPNIWSFGAQPPVPWSESIPVVLARVFVESPDHRVELFLGPIYDADAVMYAPMTNPQDGPVALHAVNGDFAQPLAIINDLAVVPDLDRTWGGVKSLYR